MVSGPMFAWLTQINLIVGLSNLVPIWGTDGDHALDAICLSATPPAAEPN
jgi:Zn-dependent protease